MLQLILKQPSSYGARTVGWCKPHSIGARKGTLRATLHCVALHLVRTQRTLRRGALMHARHRVSAAASTL